MRDKRPNSRLGWTVCIRLPVWSTSCSDNFPIQHVCSEVKLKVRRKYVSLACAHDFIVHWADGEIIQESLMSTHRDRKEEWPREANPQGVTETIEVEKPIFEGIRKAPVVYFSIINHFKKWVGLGQISLAIFFIIFCLSEITYDCAVMCDVVFLSILSLFSMIKTIKNSNYSTFKWQKFFKK